MRRTLAYVGACLQAISTRTDVAKAEGLMTEHIVALEDLKPGTRYFYTFGATPAVKAPAGSSLSL